MLGRNQSQELIRIVTSKHETGLTPWVAGTEGLMGSKVLAVRPSRKAYAKGPMVRYLLCDRSSCFLLHMTITPNVDCYFGGKLVR